MVYRTDENGIIIPNIKPIPNVELIGNYVVFKNISLVDFSIRMKNVSIGDQSPLSQPSIAGIQIVSGAGKENLPLNGDYDKDVVLGDNGEVHFHRNVPFGVNDDDVVVKNKVVDIFADTELPDGQTALNQSDYIVTGRNRDIIIGGNGDDRIDAGSGNDLAIGDNANVHMVDYNAIGERLDNALKILDLDETDNNQYIGKAVSFAGIRFIALVNSGQRFLAMGFCAGAPEGP